MKIPCNFCEIYLKLKDLYKKKLNKLISGQNIKTINYKSILGEGNLDIEGGTSSSQLLGYVNQNTEHLPTTRTDGTPAEKEDYVKPESNATFPFTIDGITFNTRLDRAIYLGDGRWMIDAGVILQTNETPVSNETLESLTGDATFQSNVNEQFAEIIGKNKTITVDDEETLIDAVNYIWDEVSKLGGKVLKFKGFISNTTPTGTITDGSLWYQDAELPTTFPINVKTYNAETSQWSSTTSTYNPTTFDLWANLNNNNGYYWFGNEWNLIDENVLVDNKTIHKNLEKELELKDGNNIDGVTFLKLNYNLYTEEVVDDDESLPLNSAVYKELLDNTNSKFEYDDSDTEKDLLTITLKNNNRDIIFEKEIDFDDKLVFEKKEQTLTNKTIDADDNEILNLTGENVKDDFMVHDIKASDYHYGFTHNTDNVFTNTTQDGLVNVYSISDEKVITLLGEGTLAGTTLTYDSVAYTRNDTLDDYYIDQSDIKFSSVDMAIFLKKLIDGQKVSFKKVSTFAGELGDLNTLYYLTTSYDNYKKGFYLYNGTVFYQIDYKSVKYVSTFNGIEGDNEALYYLDTDYSTYVKGFYRYVETTTEGVTTGEYVLIGHNQVVYLSTFTGVTGNTEKLYYLDTAYEDYKKGFYRYNGTNFVNINPKHFFIVSTFTGVEGDDEALYYLDTKYDTYKVGFYRFIPAEGGNPDRFVPIGRSLVKYVSTFNGEEGDTDVLYYLDTAYNDYKVGFYRYVETQGTTPAEFLLIGSASEVFTDVDTLPQEDISDATIYRLKVFKYFYEGKEIVQPVGYKSINTVCSISSDYIAVAGGDTYEWEDVDDTVSDYLISQNYLAEVSDFEEAEMFRLRYNKYVYFPLVDKVPRYELYHNPEKNPAQYLLIDDERVKKYTTSGLHAYTHDGITQDEMPIVTEIGDNDPTSQEVHALDTNLATELAIRKAIDENMAIIDVETLPTEDINIHSLYRVSNDYYQGGGDEYTAIQMYEILSDTVVASASELVWDGTHYAWENVTDSVIAELLTISDIQVTTSFSDAKIIKLDAHLYDYVENVTVVKAGLYHNLDKDVVDWILVGGGTDVSLDDITTETVNNKVQANAVIPVNALPTTNIKEKSLYEITETVSWEEHHYTHNTNPVVEIKSYKLTPTGGQVLEITENDGIWFAHTQTLTPWNELTESTIDYYILINRLMECDFDDADKQFSGYKENAESAWKYDYKTKVADTPTTETFSMTKLFRRRNNQWQSVSTIKLTSEQYARLTNAQKADGTIYILDTDYVEAIIDVTELPTEDIETQSLYRINEHVHKEEWHYYHNDVELNEPPLLYRSTSPNFVVSETKVTVNGVDYQYAELNSTLIESWLGTYIETVSEFNNAQFCCYDVEYFDYAGNFTFEHPIVDFNMLKLFSRYNDTWKSHSTIKLTEEQYDALTAAQKNDTTVYIVGSNAEVLVDEITAEFVDDKLQANAVISVDALPTTNIKDNSFYELTENIQYGDYNYLYSDGSSIISLDSAPTCYKVTEAGVEYGMVVTTDYIEEPSQIGPATQYYFRSGHPFQVNEVYVEIWLENGYISQVDWDEREFCGYNNGTEFDHGNYFSREGSSQSFSMTKLFKRRNNAWQSISTIKVTDEVYNTLTEDQKNDGTVYIVGENVAIIDVDALPTTNIASDVLYRLNIKECKRKPTGDVIENAVAYRSKNLEECSYNTDGISIRPPGEEPMFYPWDNVDDTIISDLVSGGYIEETSLEQGDFFKAASNFYLYKTSVEFTSYYELYHNPTATADAFIKVGGGDVDVDNQTIVEVENKLRANAIIDIETLPTTNILKNTIYRKYGEAYMYKGSEIAQPTGYVSADTERVVITATGIDHMEEGTLLNHYNWEDVTNSVIFTVGNLAPATFEEAEMFKIGDNQYDYKTTVTHEQVCELYHNPTGLQNDYKLIGGGGSAEVDEVTTELVNDKVQANAIIPVTSLPTTNIKEKSLYQYTENVGYVLDHWTRGDEEIETPQHFYKSTSYYLQVYNGEILYYHEESGDTDWPYPNNHVEWYRFADEHLNYFLNKNLIVECTPTDGTFCEYAAGKYDWVNDGTSATMGVKHTSETKNFSMTKLFKRDNGNWLSISVIGLTKEQYDNLPTSIKNDGTLYIVDDAAELAVEMTYKALADKPVVNGITLNGSLTLEDLGLYSRNEVNALLENKGQVEFVSELPATPTTNTWYYSTKFEDGTTVPDDKRALYIVDEDITQYHYMGIVGDIEMETGDTLSGSENLVTSSQVVKKELSTKLNKYGTQVNIETAVNDATLWTTLAQIDTDDKKTDSSMVFNAGTCYLIGSVSPTNTAQIYQFIVTGSVGSSAINKKITLINPLTNEIFTKSMDGGVWQAWKGGKKYKHTLVRYNNDSFQYTMGWTSVISNKKTMSVDDFKTWLNEKGYTSATNPYYWCGGCCGTTEVRNGDGTGKAYVGRVASGVFYDGTNLFFKWDYNGTTQINPARCKIVTEELN